MHVTYVLETAPGGGLRLKRSGPGGYFTLRGFASWQEWEAYRDHPRNARQWAAPDRLLGEDTLPPGWAGKPEETHR